MNFHFISYFFKSAYVLWLMLIFINNISTWTHTATCVKWEKVYVVYSKAYSDRLKCTNNGVSDADIEFLMVTLSYLI